MFALILMGCATSSATYNPPDVSGRIANSKQVDKPFDQLWDSLVRQLSSDFFVINNIDKSSRLINLSFSSSTPSKYIDCGRTIRKFSDARGEQVFDYATADSAKFQASTPQGTTLNVTRGTRLEGRSNIYIAPHSAGSEVSVNTKYVLQVTMSATDPLGRPAGTLTTPIDFSTKQPSTSGTDNATCKSIGAIEQTILDMAK